MNPAAKAPKRPMTCWSATAEAGGSSDRDGIQPASPRDFRRRFGRDGDGRGGTRDRADIGKSRPRGDLPDRRLEPEKALSIARHRHLPKPDSMAAGALVHRRRALRADG